MLLDPEPSDYEEIFFIWLVILVGTALAIFWFIGVPIAIYNDVGWTGPVMFYIIHMVVFVPPYVYVKYKIAKQEQKEHEEELKKYGL